MRKRVRLECGRARLPMHYVGECGREESGRASARMTARAPRAGVCGRARERASSRVRASPRAREGGRARACERVGRQCARAPRSTRSSGPGRRARRGPWAPAPRATGRSPIPGCGCRPTPRSDARQRARQDARGADGFRRRRRRAGGRARPHNHGPADCCRRLAAAVRGGMARLRAGRGQIAPAR